MCATAKGIEDCRTATPAFLFFLEGGVSSRVLVISWRNLSGAFGGHHVHTILLVNVKFLQDLCVVISFLSLFYILHAQICF